MKFSKVIAYLWTIQKKQNAGDSKKSKIIGSHASATEMSISYVIINFIVNLLQCASHLKEILHFMEIQFTYFRIFKKPLEFLN